MEHWVGIHADTARRFRGYRPVLTFGLADSLPAEAASGYGRQASWSLRDEMLDQAGELAGCGLIIASLVNKHSWRSTARVIAFTLGQSCLTIHVL
jgi:hypothetical protein